MSDTPRTDAWMASIPSDQGIEDRHSALWGFARQLECELAAAQAKLAGDIEQLDSPPWRCFHCGEFFTDKKEAAIHFGPTREFDEPRCVARMTTSEDDLRRQMVESHQERDAAQAEAAEAENDRRLLSNMQHELAARFDGATTVWLAADRYDNARFELKQVQARIAKFESAEMPEEPARYEFVGLPDPMMLYSDLQSEHYSGDYILWADYIDFRTFAATQKVRADENERDARRYRFLRPLYTGIDFEYGDSSEGTTPSIIFAIPPDSRWSGNLDASVDAALDAAKGE